MFKMAIALFCFAVSCKADAITTEFSCESSLGSASGPTPCSFEDSTNTQSSASAGGTYSLSAISGLTNSFSVSASVFVGGSAVFFNTPYPGMTLGSSASALIEVSLTLMTSGPVRPGIIENSIITDEGGGALETHVSSSFQVGPYSVEEVEGCVYCGSYPFTLGVPFTVSITDSASGFADILDATGISGSVSSTLNFSLFEADGVTPVPIEAATSEPGTLGLGLLGVGALAWRRRSPS